MREIEVSLRNLSTAPLIGRSGMHGLLSNPSCCTALKFVTFEKSEHRILTAIIISIYLIGGAGDVLHLST